MISRAMDCKQASATAFKTISGPMPLASPIVIPIRGLLKRLTFPSQSYTGTVAGKGSLFLFLFFVALFYLIILNLFHNLFIFSRVFFGCRLGRGAAVVFMDVLNVMFQYQQIRALVAMQFDAVAVIPLNGSGEAFAIL